MGGGGRRRSRLSGHPEHRDPAGARPLPRRVCRVVTQREGWPRRRYRGGIRRTTRSRDDEARRAQRRLRRVLLGGHDGCRSRAGHRVGRRPGRPLLVQRAGQPPVRQVRASAVPGPRGQPGLPRPHARRVRCQRAVRHPGHVPHDHPGLPHELAGRGRRDPQADADADDICAQPEEVRTGPGGRQGASPGRRGAPRRARGLRRDLPLQPSRVPGHRPWHHHERCRLQLRPRGLPGRERAQARHGLPAAAAPGPRVRRAGRAARCPGGARPVRRGAGPPPGHRRLPAGRRGRRPTP